MGDRKRDPRRQYPLLLPGPDIESVRGLVLSRGEAREPIQIQTHLNDRLPVSGYVFGWLDRDHLVFQRPGAATLSVFDLTSRSSTDLPGAEYLGFFPGWLS